MQGNMAYYHSQRSEFLDEQMAKVKNLASNYASILDYTSGEDDYTDESPQK